MRITKTKEQQGQDAKRKEQGTIMEDKDKMSMELLSAAIEGDLKAVKELLSHGAGPNFQNDSGDTALILASFNNYPALAELLLSHGADPTLKDHTTSQRLTATKDLPQPSRRRWISMRPRRRRKG